MCEDTASLSNSQLCVGPAGTLQTLPLQGATRTGQESKQVIESHLLPPRETRCEQALREFLLVAVMLVRPPSSRAKHPNILLTSPPGAPAVQGRGAQCPSPVRIPPGKARRKLCSEDPPARQTGEGGASGNRIQPCTQQRGLTTTLYQSSSAGIRGVMGSACHTAR